MQIDLFVREYDGHTGPPGGRRAVLMLHGRSVPVLAGFDLRHKSYSWADALAKAGYDVFLMDLQGSGRSPRPKMDDPCNVNRPSTRVSSPPTRSPAGVSPATRTS
ncbi:alpha/beta fold hydrolase [Streptomyces sp. NPDC056956]|uniref:alpha/beta fold hydrolase n=1 Tax=Streptomyces sp. NPDC056956 TaxID=3345980 RepID=UPI003634AC21